MTVSLSRHVSLVTYLWQFAYKVSRVLGVFIFFRFIFDLFEDWFRLVVTTISYNKDANDYLTPPRSISF